MKKLISTIVLSLIVLMAQAQILTPVTWEIRLDDKNGATEKEIIFTATCEKGWHLYDMNLPEGGPVSTSFTFETLTGAKLIGEPTPSVKPTTVYDEQFAMDLRWYAGSVSFTQKFQVTDAKKFKMEGEVEFMAVSIYHSGVKTSGVVKIIKDIDINPQDINILIVEDILDSGLTLKYLKDLLLQRNASNIRRYAQESAGARPSVVNA